LPHQIVLDDLVFECGKATGGLQEERNIVILFARLVG